MVALNRRLEQVVTGIITRHKRPLDFNGVGILPQQYDLHASAKTLTRETMDVRGKARIGTGEGNDTPLTQVEIREVSEDTVMVDAAYKMSVTEMDAMELASMNKQQATNTLQYRVNGTNEVIDEAVNLLGAFGMPELGIKGMLNQDYDIQVETTDPSTLSGDAQALLSWITSKYSRRRKVTRKAEKPNMILITEDLDDLLRTTLFQDGSVSVMDKLLDTQRSKGLMGIMCVNELESADLEKYGVHAEGTDLDRMMIYTLDRSGMTLNRKLSRKIQYPSEYRDRHYINYIGQRVSSVYANHLGAAEYIDYPKAPAA